MLEEKVFIKDELATIICPNCRKASIEDVSPFKYFEESVKITFHCSCGHSHTVLLERRRFFRKEVHLPGMYSQAGSKDLKPMTVRDISRSGIKIKVEETDLNVGDKLYVEFRLDNKHHTLIKKEVIVRNHFKNSLGCEFCSRNLKNPYDKAYDIAIGFFTYS